MDTKLRSFSTNTATKIIAFILTVVFITVAVAQMQYIVYSDMNPELLFTREYKNSEKFISNYVSPAIH